MSATASPTIKLDQIVQRFEAGVKVLSELQLEVPAGQFAAILGPSGCGKSTLLRIISGLVCPTSGTVTIESADHRKVDMGFVFQQATLLPWRRVLDNIALPLELRGVRRAERSAAADAARQLVGLADTDVQKFPRMLSGGMQMRVSIARALVTNPQVMLLDEPFAALDDILRGQLNDDLAKLWLENRWTTLFVTHNVSEAVYLSERVLIMSAVPGRIVSEISINMPFPRSQHLRATPEFAALVGQVSNALMESVR